MVTLQYPHLDENEIDIEINNYNWLHLQNLEYVTLLSLIEKQTELHYTTMK